VSGPSPGYWFNPVGCECLYNPNGFLERVCHACEEEFQHGPRIVPPTDPEVDAAVDAAFLAFETAERNARALDDWRCRRTWSGFQRDPARSPVERFLLNRWYAERRTWAREWLTRPQFHRRQAG
jgi:hypothetical protein